MKAGDRVASYSSNCIVSISHPLQFRLFLTTSVARLSIETIFFFGHISQENIAACLAATAIGGIWVSAAADFGPEGVLER